MSRRSKYWLLTAVVLLPGAAIGWVIWMSSPSPLPPLLKGRLTGGIADGCSHGHILAGVSPEFNQRLAEQFPAGTRTEQLVRTLDEQGFHLEPCTRDPTIWQATFCGQSGWRSGPRAHVYWKSDSAGRITWAGGYVFYVC